MTISREQVEKLRAKLTQAPPAPPAASVNTTKQEAVRSLVGEIRALQQRGYTLEQVAELFREEGVLLTTQTLKNYLARAKAPRKRRAGKRATGVGARAPAPAAGTPRVSVPETGGGEKSEATPATRPTPRAEARPAVAGSEARGGGEASPEAPDGSKLRSGKDAFRTKDKDHY